MSRSFTYTQPDELEWRTATYSSGGNCVEVAPLPDRSGVVVRHSTNRDGDVLQYTPAEWRAFILGAKDGEFDHLV